MDLTVQCYTLTQAFPKQEMFGLTSQIRRAAVSIPSNIAEGQGRNSTREFLNHLSIARGSLFELETQLCISERVKLLDTKRCDGAIEVTSRIGRMLAGLRKSLESRVS
ncbi:MAG: four helix bundle protein [Gemmataceae bacterium]|nr:four helix bundle protein [Gemmataceae bacterium]MCI0739791.1 four helix bundle protein [Gemmataceae bacterium]